MPVLDLVDCIKPGSVVYDNVASGTDEEVGGVHVSTCMYMYMLIVEKRA